MTSSAFVPGTWGELPEILDGSPAQGATVVVLSPSPPAISMWAANVRFIPPQLLPGNPVMELLALGERMPRAAGGAYGLSRWPFWGLGFMGEQAINKLLF